MYIIGLILLGTVIADGLFLWAINGRARYPVKRLLNNMAATVIGGMLIWSS